MKIDRVTITGADDKTDIKQLLSISMKYPFVEWGILFSHSRKGTNRYPSMKWIEQLLKTKKESNFPINLSAHLCGQYPRDILQRGNYEIFDFLSSEFNRMQLNFNFSNTLFTFEYLSNIFESIDKKNISIIFQYNKSNVEVIEELIDHRYRFDILFDSSGGGGTEIKEIKAPFKNYYTGYSGGLNPDNIEEFCKQIASFTNNSTVFIDCESGVRTNDEFDLEKARKYLEISSNFVTYAKEKDLV